MDIDSVVSGRYNLRSSSDRLERCSQDYSETPAGQPLPSVGVLEVIGL